MPGTSRRSIVDAALAAGSGLGILAALYLIFHVVPTERVQGVVQRIFYIHVPSAWAAFTGFGLVCLGSAVHLWKGGERWDRLARASAEVGLLFCTFVLLTGPIWARPIWGVWWSWDPRLTMTVILWTIYAAYLLLRAFGGGEESVKRYAAVLGIVGAIDIPLIIVSVKIWRGIHPSVLASRGGGESGLADPWMRITLYFTAIAVLILFSWMVRIRMRLLRVEDGVESLHRDVRPA